MVVIRPADANEMTEAYRCILQLQHRPAALICSRQPLPIVDRTQFAPAAGLAKGAYVLADAPDGTPDVILIASGSEVALCVAARERLVADGVRAASSACRHGNCSRRRTRRIATACCRPR